MDRHLRWCSQRYRCGLKPYRRKIGPICPGGPGERSRHPGLSRLGQPQGRVTLIKWRAPDDPRALFLLPHKFTFYDDLKSEFPRLNREWIIKWTSHTPVLAYYARGVHGEFESFFHLPRTQVPGSENSVISHGTVLAYGARECVAKIQEAHPFSHSPTISALTNRLMWI